MSKTHVLVFDNGTSECRAGTNKDGLPEIVVKNQLCRIKEKEGKITYTMENSKRRKMCASSAVTIKSMFDGPVVYNYEIFKSTVEAILSEIKEKKIKTIVVTECFLNPKMFRVQMLDVLFGYFNFQKVQLGYDFIYSYEYNMKNNPNMCKENIMDGNFCDIIISMGHQGIHTIPVDPQTKKIIYSLSGFLPFGGLLAQNVFCSMVSAKYYGTGIKIPKEEVETAFRSIKVLQSYTKEIEEVAYKGKDNLKIDLKGAVKEKIPKQKFFLKRKIEKKETIRKRKISEETDKEEDGGTEDLELPQEIESKGVTEKPDNNVNDIDITAAPKEDTAAQLENEGKRIKKERLIRGAAEHRNKQKLMQVLKKLETHIMWLEERDLFVNNPEKLMERRKAHMAALQKILKKRSFIRNELKNKKSLYSLALLKQTLSSANQTPSPENNIYLNDAKEAQESDTEIIEEIESIDAFLRENDKAYKSKEENVVDRIKNGYGKEKGGVNINIEFPRTAEVIFNPSIIGIENPGILELLSDIFQVYNVRNIFLTGGFSQISGIKERIEKEIVSMRYVPNTPTVSMALDPMYDTFKGAFFLSEYFPIYTQREYKEKKDSLVQEIIL